MNRLQEHMIIEIGMTIVAARLIWLALGGATWAGRVTSGILAAVVISAVVAVKFAGVLV